MELLWCKYKQTENRLFLYLGEHNGKACCIDANAIDHGTKITIREAAPILDDLSLESKVNWIKENCPGAMASYRTLNKTDIQVYSKMEVKPEQQENAEIIESDEESAPSQSSSDA